ncbi:MAG: ABC transporter substrate-binding protein [Dehalococcoidia bacterium]|nr:ABC transporter substrate-binding protein [Dehalococcoidia bacterium]
MTHLRGSLGSTYSKVIASVLMLFLLLVVGCGAAATATPAPLATTTPSPAAGASATPTAMPRATAAPTVPAVNPGKVTWMIGDFGNGRFDPTFTTSNSQDYTRLTHGFLVSSNAKEGRREVVPGIASDWKVSSDSLTWTFTIRKGVKFHDGTEVTAEDAVWSLRHIMGPQAVEYATTSATVLARIVDRIEQTGPDQVSVTTKVPTAGFPTGISEAGSSPHGFVLPKRATLHDLKDEEAYDRNPIGAGLGKLVKQVPAAQMTFERFADYYYQPKNGLPTDKRLNFTLLDLRLISEEATRMAALRAGEADIAPVSLSSRKQVEAGGGRLVFGQEGVYVEIFQMGCMRPENPCHDRRVRQALSYAMDRGIIRDRLYGGPEVLQVKGWGAVTPSSIGYSPELDPFPFDPVKARQLLAEAGYPGGKGFGKLVINTLVSTSAPLLPESAQIGAGDWRKELGLDVEVKVWDAAALQKTVSLTEDLYGQIFWRANQTELDASRLLRKFYADPEQKSRRHDDPELLALTGKALTVFDSVEREKALNSAYRRMRDEAYDIPLGYFNIPWGVGPRIQTWQPDPLAFHISALHTITLK